MTSVAASMMASACFLSSSPSEWFTEAAARLIIPIALMTDRGMRRG